MTPIPPIPFRWDGESMVPRHPRIADRHFVIGEDYTLVPHEERSERAHRAFFATVNDVWKSLPEHLAMEYPTAEALRKRALIKAGFCSMTDYACSSRAEAVRWAENLRREADPYTLVVVSESVVRVFKAESQSQKAMGKERFMASMEAVFNVLGELVGVSPDTLRRQNPAPGLSGQGAGAGRSHDFPAGAASQSSPRAA